ncbi:Nn.00g074420.m01.CDS01 [Neocucurbitaria sp. VM-36]
MNDYRFTLNAVGWVLAALSTLFIAARTYTRTKITTSMLGWDDWCMLVAWMFAIVCTSLVATGTTYGLGLHVGDIKDPEDQAMAAMYVLLAPIFSITSAFFTKTSIIVAFMRIMGPTVTWVHKLIAYAPLAVLFAGSAISCGIMIFFCSPVERSWRPYLAGSCLDPVLLDIVGKTVSAYNAVMDAFCACVPYFLIRNLNIPRKDKRNLIILMGGSIFGTFATIMKIVAMSNISNVADITHSWSEITIWYLTENHVLIIAASFPALRPFWRTLIGKYSSYRSSNKSGSSSQSPSQKRDDASFPLPVVGTATKVKRKPGLYSIPVGDSSEESLNPQHREGETESVEAILSYHGDQRIDHTTRVTGGNSVVRPGAGDPSIRVTREVNVK